MSKERYLQNAIECERAANHAVDLSTKAMYGKLAKHWLLLAEQVKRLNHEGPPPWARPLNIGPTH